MPEGYDNSAYISDKPNENVTRSAIIGNENGSSKAEQDRDNWGRGIEFLLSCIAMR